MTARFSSAKFALICFAGASCASACDNSAPQTLASVQESHIAANAPADEEFEALLMRDLGAYFASQGMTDPQVRYELLRRGPTQSGVAYPKYYVWVSAESASGDTMAGAMRVAAVDRIRFEVTDYVSRQEVLTNPDAIASVFPAALLPAIRAKATAR
jgi:hypothetical protein